MRKYRIKEITAKDRRNNKYREYIIQERLFGIWFKRRKIKTRGCRLIGYTNKNDNIKIRTK